MGPNGTGASGILKILEDSGYHYVRSYGRLGASRSSTSGDKALLFHDSNADIRRSFLYIKQEDVRLSLENWSVRKTSSASEPE